MRRHVLVRLAAGLSLAALALFALAAVVPLAVSRLRHTDAPPAQTVALDKPASPLVEELHEWVVELAPDADPIEVAREHGFVYKGVLQGLRGFHRFERMPPSALSQRRETRSLRRSAEEQESVLWAEPQVPRKRETRATLPEDPLYAQQWHLKAAGVDAAWLAPTKSEYGPRGRGVLISIVDDGLAIAHPDLAPRYVAAASRDVNSRRAEPLHQRGASHGTSAAAVALGAENTFCGVGAAPLASLAGVRLIGAPATDADEAEAFGVGLTIAGSTERGVSIYSNSWGPADTGAAMEGPGRLAKLALERGTREGRGGRGAVYVWASGNGRANGDACSYDGYASSRFVLAVGAVGRHGKTPWYSEGCPALLVVAPSSDGIDSIATARAPSGCTTSFGGTSAAAPLVSGIVALALEVRPELSWRDVRALLVATSERTDATYADWQLNGASLWTSHAYGFGAVNASRLVRAARSWRLLGDEVADETPVMRNEGAARPGVPLEARASFVSSVERLESVELTLSVACYARGSLTLTLVSPSGTRSVFAQPHADYAPNISGWTFTSVRAYGERVRGEWTLRLETTQGEARLDAWQLAFYGT